MRDNTIVEKARAVRVEDELARRDFPFWTKPRHNNLGQPCPMCSGADRFSVNTKKQLFNCQGCGDCGDVINLVRTWPLGFGRAESRFRKATLPGHTY